MKQTYFFTLVLAIILFATNSILLSQETEEKPGNIFTIDTQKIPFDELNEYLDLWEKEAKPIYQKNEFIVSCKIFVHVFGPDWTVMMITEYESLAAIDEANNRQSELVNERFPDEEQRKKMVKKFQSFSEGHSDAIVREVVKLRK